jgi:signal transduction histidine kinase
MLLSPRNLKFRHRKKLHFSLITAIVLFQLLLLLIIYNEIFNEAKLDSITNQLQQASKIKTILERSKSHQLKAQANFKDFINTHKKEYLDLFKKNTASLNASIDTLSTMSESNSSWNEFLSKELPGSQNQKDIKSKMDSVLQLKLPGDFNFDSPSIQLTPYNYKDVLNSIKVETTKEVDTVKKKGFFSRLGKALSGKSDVQKEKVNILVTMKFGKEVVSGDVTTQLGKAFEKTNSYYSDAFATIQSNLKSNLLEQQKKEASFAALNLQLLIYSGGLLESYEKTLGDFTKLANTRFNKQYQTNKAIRNYTIIGLAVLVIIISFILFFFTRIAFDYEKQLYKAQIKIQESLQFKDRIVSMISHEIRSPLSIISIYSKYLSSKIKDEEIKNVFDSIQFTTNSLYTLSNQILEFSKNENKKMQLNKQIFNLKDEFLAMEKTLKTVVESNENSFIFENNLPDHSNVNSDVVKIHQLLYNAIGNANKFTNKGQVKLSCTLKERNQYQWNLEVIVEDTGVGISKTDLEHIFDNFYQAGKEEKVHNLGAGIGLNLCKDLAELFQGNINVSSELNKGTTVAFNLVLDKVNEGFVN